MTRRLLLGLWSAVLPASERERLETRLEYDLPTVPASWALGAVQIGLIPVWALVGLAYANSVAGIQAEAILATEVPPLFIETMLGSVGLGLLAYLVSPPGVLLEYVIITGVVRIAGLVASGRPTGDPLVTLLAWLKRLAGAEIRQQRRLRALGPPRPDRVLPDGRGLLVLSSRDKPDWNERVTIEYEGAFYRLVRQEDRPHGRWVEVALLLRPQQPGELIRSLVKLETPPESSRDDPDAV
jgi:hypothetical protein